MAVEVGKVELSVAPARAFAEVRAFVDDFALNGLER
jgi:hypothetical protein